MSQAVHDEDSKRRSHSTEKKKLEEDILERYFNVTFFSGPLMAGRSSRSSRLGDGGALVKFPGGRRREKYPSDMRPLGLFRARLNRAAPVYCTSERSLNLTTRISHYSSMWPYAPTFVVGCAFIIRITAHASFMYLCCSSE